MKKNLVIATSDRESSLYVIFQSTRVTNDNWLETVCKNSATSNKKQSDSQRFLEISLQNRRCHMTWTGHHDMNRCCLFGLM